MDSGSCNPGGFEVIRYQLKQLCIAAILWVGAFCVHAGNDYRGLWVGEAKLNYVTEVAVGLDENNVSVAPDPTKPTSTADEAQLRLILHVDQAGKVHLLKDVAILQRDQSIVSNGYYASELDLALVTDERLYADFPQQKAVRIGSAAFDFCDIRSTRAVDAFADAISEAVAGTTYAAELQRNRTQLQAAYSLATNHVALAQIPAAGDFLANATVSSNNLMMAISDVRDAAVFANQVADPVLATHLFDAETNVVAAIQENVKLSLLYSNCVVMNQLKNGISPYQVTAIPNLLPVAASARSNYVATLVVCTNALTALTNQLGQLSSDHDLYTYIQNVGVPTTIQSQRVASWLNSWRTAYSSFLNAYQTAVVAQNGFISTVNQLRGSYPVRYQGRITSVENDMSSNLASASALNAVVNNEFDQIAYTASNAVVRADFSVLSGILNSWNTFNLQHSLTNASSSLTSWFNILPRGLVEDDQAYLSRLDDVRLADLTHTAATIGSQANSLSALFTEPSTNGAYAVSAISLGVNLSGIQQVLEQSYRAVNAKQRSQVTGASTSVAALDVRSGEMVDAAKSATVTKASDPAAAARNAANGVLNSMDVANNYYTFLQLFTDSVITDLIQNGVPNTLWDAASDLFTSYYGDRRGVDLLRNLDDLYEQGSFTKEDAHRVLARFADVDNVYGRFIHGASFGEMVVDAANEAAVLASTGGVTQAMLTNSLYQLSASQVAIQDGLNAQVIHYDTAASDALSQVLTVMADYAWSVRYDAVAQALRSVTNVVHQSAANVSGLIANIDDAVVMAGTGKPAEIQAVLTSLSAEAHAGHTSVSNLMNAVDATASEFLAMYEVLPAKVEEAGINALSGLRQSAIAVATAPSAAFNDFVRDGDLKASVDAVVLAATDAAAYETRQQYAYWDGLSVERATRLGVREELMSLYGQAARVPLTALPLEGSFELGAGDVTRWADAGSNVGPAGLEGEIILPENHPTNPFRHRRHPDHTSGFEITRHLRFDFDGASTNALEQTGLGVDRLTGVYREELFGLHKKLGPKADMGLRVEGTFELHRISLIDTLNAK